MTPFSSKGLSLENKLIGNILREYPPVGQDHGKIFWWTLPGKAGI